MSIEPQTNEGRTTDAAQVDVNESVEDNSTVAAKRMSRSIAALKRGDVDLAQLEIDASQAIEPSALGKFVSQSIEYIRLRPALLRARALERDLPDVQSGGPSMRKIVAMLRADLGVVTAGSEDGVVESNEGSDPVEIHTLLAVLQGANG